MLPENNVSFQRSLFSAMLYTGDTHYSAGPLWLFHRLAVKFMNITGGQNKFQTNFKELRKMIEIILQLDPVN